MRTGHETIEIGDLPELRRVAEEVRDRRAPIVLQEHGEDIAVVTPFVLKRGDPNWRPSPEDIAIAMEAFGSWQSEIDPEEFKARVKAARGSHRPPADS